MNVKAIAERYARAAYELTVENKTQDKVFSDLRALERAFSADREITVFLDNPMISGEDHVQVLQKAMNGKGVSQEATDLILLLARRGRFSLFKDVVHAFEAQADDAHGVARGTVRSATALAPAERQRIESVVESVLKKKVILHYTVDPSVIGGLIAQVGSYTFDDSIAYHLRRMNEELKRRTV